MVSVEISAEGLGSRCNLVERNVWRWWAVGGDGRATQNKGRSCLSCLCECPVLEVRFLWCLCTGLPLDPLRSSFFVFCVSFSSF